MRLKLNKIILFLLSVLLLTPMTAQAAEVTSSLSVTNPYVLSALIIVSVLSIVYGILTSDFSVAGIVLAISIGLFFYINFVLLGRDLIIFVLFLTGLALIILEVFIPGFGLPGIAGIVLLVLGIVRSFNSLQMALITLIIAALISIGLSYVIIKTGKNSSYIQKLILNDSIQGRSTSDIEGIYNGLQGKTLTDLKPSGYAQILDKKVFVFSRDGYINRGSDIIVIEIKGSQIYVKEVEHE